MTDHKPHPLPTDLERLQRYGEGIGIRVNVYAHDEDTTFLVFTSLYGKTTIQIPASDNWFDIGVNWLDQYSQNWQAAIRAAAGL